MRCIYNLNSVIHVSSTPVGALVEIVQWGNHDYAGRKMRRDKQGLYAIDNTWYASIIGSRLWNNLNILEFAKLRNTDVLVRIIE